MFPNISENCSLTPFFLPLAQVAIERLLPFRAADLRQQRAVQLLTLGEPRLQTERVVLALDRSRQNLDTRLGILEQVAQQRFVVDQRLGMTKKGSESNCF